MSDTVQFPYTSVTDSTGLSALRPILPIRLLANGYQMDTDGLLDTGADVNVLPYRVGVALGLDWQILRPLSGLSGNLSQYESRGVAVTGHINSTSFAPVRLIFAWTRSENVPLILGQVNFLLEFDVCFFRNRAILEITPKV